MVPTILFTAAAACLFTEFAGYWLHVLLHSERIEFLSRNHMIHHLIVYAPNKPMRPSREYLGSTFDRASILGIGMEWLLPAALLIAALLGACRLLGIAALSQAVFITTSLAWGYLMFGYMHDSMHLQGFWMGGNRWLAGWYLGARRLHDIHHMELEDDGREAKNFGICFFLFDRLFGSLSTEHKKFNHKGLEAARNRYAYIYPGNTPPVPLP